MTLNKTTSVFARTWSTPVILIGLLVIIALVAVAAGSGTFSRTIAEIFIRVTLVVGMYIFIGNSGVISFGHAGFMCLGAYGAAWLTIPPMMKKILLPGLTPLLADAQLPLVVSAVVAALFAAAIALISGAVLMRLAGIAASIGTFAMLAVINTIYSNWQSVTAATSSVVGIPIATGIWSSLAGAAVAILIAYLYGISRSGLALRAGRDEAVAAAASGVDIYRERLIAFIISAFVCGLAGVLYAHFLGVVNPDAFYLGVTFIALSMLVVGGMGSLSGAVVGVVVISAIIQILRWMEKGIEIGGANISLPNGIQEIVIGIVMIIILIVRPTGLMQNKDLSWGASAPRKGGTGD
jgi:branched-chain amino acid transport system permease protein